MDVLPELIRHNLLSACPTQHLGANFTENAKPMSSATGCNNQQPIAHPETYWTCIWAGLGQEILAQRWCSLKLRYDLASFD